MTNKIVIDTAALKALLASHPQVEIELLAVAHEKVAEELKRKLPDDADDKCDTCGAPLDDGEGYDGKCGSCADGVVNDEAKVEAYLASDGTACPHCGSQHLSGGPVEVDAGGAFQDITCGACGETWTDEYTLTGVAL